MSIIMFSKKTWKKPEEASWRNAGLWSRSEFELKSRYEVYFRTYTLGKGFESSYPQTTG